MTRYIPVVAGVLLIVGLTIVQAEMTDRLAESNVTAEQQAELLKLVPKSFGDWHGEDKPVDPNVKEKAGSVGAAVSRNYRNARTGERVDLWLIVGHARDISAHTPDICYPGSGFEARAKENGLYPFVVNGQGNVVFDQYVLQGRCDRATIAPRFLDVVQSDAKRIKGRLCGKRRKTLVGISAIRGHFTRCISRAKCATRMETAEQSACIHFARDFLPEVDKALTKPCNRPSRRRRRQTAKARREQRRRAADKPATKQLPATAAAESGRPTRSRPKTMRGASADASRGRTDR